MLYENGFGELLLLEMNDLLSSFLNGLVAGTGMFLASAIFGFLIFRLTKKWITKTVSEIWTKVRAEGFKLDGIQIDGSLQTKRINKKHKK
jgi:hypothetical protein